MRQWCFHSPKNINCPQNCKSMLWTQAFLWGGKNYLRPRHKMAEMYPATTLKEHTPWLELPHRSRCSLKSGTSPWSPPIWWSSCYRILLFKDWPYHAFLSGNSRPPQCSQGTESKGSVSYWTNVILPPTTISRLTVVGIAQMSWKTRSWKVNFWYWNIDLKLVRFQGTARELESLSGTLWGRLCGKLELRVCVREAFCAAMNVVCWGLDISCD